jgi:hypothetical protein
VVLPASIHGLLEKVRLPKSEVQEGGCIPLTLETRPTLDRKC